MKCETAQQNMVFAGYGELHDEQIDGLEEHLAGCETCREELEALRKLEETLAHHPMLEPSPNLLAHARMKLDEELDLIPAHGFLTHVRGLFFGSIASISGAPALTLLLIGLGFFAGYYTFQYQQLHRPIANKVVFQNEANSTIAAINSIVQTPDSEVVQVSYSRLVPETIQGSLDEPEIRKLLMMGSMDSSLGGVRESSVSLLASECRAQHRCLAGEDGSGIRSALLVSLRYDKNPADRLKALEGLQPYIAQDKRVRDAVLELLMHDPSASVRQAGFRLLPPVQSDSSVRKVLRTLAAQDENPYIRTASFQALQSVGDIQ